MDFLFQSADGCETYSVRRTPSCIDRTLGGELRAVSGNFSISGFVRCKNSTIYSAIKMIRRYDQPIKITCLDNRLIFDKATVLLISDQINKNNKIFDRRWVFDHDGFAACNPTIEQLPGRPYASRACQQALARSSASLTPVRRSVLAPDQHLKTAMLTGRYAFDDHSSPENLDLSSLALHADITAVPTTGAIGAWFL